MWVRDTLPENKDVVRTAFEVDWSPRQSRIPFKVVLVEATQAVSRVDVTAAC